MVLNFSTVAGPGPADAATPCTAAALTRAAPQTAATSHLILRISYLLGRRVNNTPGPGGVAASLAHTFRQPARFIRTPGHTRTAADGRAGRRHVPLVAERPRPMESAEQSRDEIDRARHDD